MKTVKEAANLPALCPGQAFWSPGVWPVDMNQAATFTNSLHLDCFGFVVFSVTASHHRTLNHRLFECCFAVLYQ